MARHCEYGGGCDREATKPYPAEPVNGWLCEEHFRQTLDAAAEIEAVARRKFEADWDAHFEKYRREHNLNLAQLTDEEARQLEDEASRWIKNWRAANDPKR